MVSHLSSPGSSMYASSPRNNNASTTSAATFAKGSPRSKMVLEEGPIKELVHVVESTRPEQWQSRTTALTDLVAQIPVGQDYSRHEAWYNSPTTLRHLHRPLGELLKDPRSTVVKRTCECLTEVFAKCQGDAKYLFKDLMPVVLDVHAQTVQIIRTQVQTMVLDAIPVVPCKMAMPVWLDRLKTDKSRTVREACVLYLGEGLKHWAVLEDNGSYLTEENWIQIATALIKTLRDPSPTVRAYTKTGIETIREAQPELWDNLIRDPDGPAGKDLKLQKWLIQMTESGEGMAATSNEELSVASRYSHYSYASSRNKSGGVGVAAVGGPSTPNSKNHVSHNAFSSSAAGGQNNRRNTAPPVQITIAGKSEQPPRQMRGLGPPLRRPFAQAAPTEPPSSTPPPLGTPPRPPGSAGSPNRGRAMQESPTAQRRSPSASPRRSGPRHKVPQRSLSTSAASTDSGVEEEGQHHHHHHYGPSSLSTPRSNHRSKPTPEQQEYHYQDQQQQAESIYTHVSSTEMLDVTKSIDQTLAHLDMPNSEPTRQPQQQQQPNQDGHNGEQQGQEQEQEEGPFITSMNELKEHASKRRSRRSLTMEQRWSLNNSSGNHHHHRHPNLNVNTNLGDMQNPIPVLPDSPRNGGTDISTLGGNSVEEVGVAAAAATGAPGVPEHYVIAEQLLRVHKQHVDQIMETLKIEMDALRDFEQSLEDSHQSPTPDQVLDYFESVGLCLDQRTTAGALLQKEMDRISKGAYMNNSSNNNNNNPEGR